MTVTPLPHVPVRLIVTLELALVESEPAVIVKSSSFDDGPSSVQGVAGGGGASAVNVTPTAKVFTVLCVTLSTTVIVTVPLYVPASRPDRSA